MGMHLRREGDSMEGTTSEMLYLSMSGRPTSTKEWSILASQAMCTVGDLTEIRRGKRTWVESLMPGLEAVMAYHRGRECPEGPMVLRPGQCWLVREAEEWHVAEVLGWRGIRIVVRKWLPRHQGVLRRTGVAKGQVLALADTSVARGEATGDEVEVKQLGSREAVRVILSADKLEKGRLVRAIESTREDMAPLLRPPRQPEAKVAREVRDAIGGGEGEWEIFVDGS